MVLIGGECNDFSAFLFFSLGQAAVRREDLLREGADVSIQAEFDGERYNARTVSVLSRNQ